MAAPTARFRTDLVDVAWEMEDDYGQPPLSDRMGRTADTTKGRLCRQWGLVTGGVTLPNPRYEWNPYFGIGVDNRNMTMAIRGRQTLEGSVPTIMLCHDTSRFALEMCFGLLFNMSDRVSNGVVSDSTNGTAAADQVNASASTPSYTSNADLSSYCIADVDKPPTHIIIVGNAADAVNVWKDTWAYIGLTTGGVAGRVEVHQDVGLSRRGWNGKVPRGFTNQKYRVCSIERSNITTSSAPQSSTVSRYVDHSSIVDHTVAMRTTLIQPSFAIAANFNADDGSRFSTNYLGNKISRTTLTFAEGEPVTFSWDFTGQDMTHNIGEDEGQTTPTTEILKYVPKFTEAQYQTAYDAADTATEAAALNAGSGATIEAGAMSTIRVNEQPYFFSGADIKFKGTTFARFRNFAISIDNAIDPRWYITQNSAGHPDSNRQIIKEILEGRRTISFTGSLDVDSTSDATPNDAVFLQWLLNQGVHGSNDVRDMPAVQGVEIQITLERVATAAGIGGDATKQFDRMHIRLPAPTGGKLGDATNNLGAAGEVGLVLRSASMNIAGPPQVHQAMDIDGFAASIAVWFEDNTN